jgi:hypothetical protein
VPLAAAGGLVLAVLLRELPRHRSGFVVLACGGGVLGASAAYNGAWMPYILPGLWIVLGVTLPTWGVVAWRSGLPAAETTPVEQPPRQAA